MTRSATLVSACMTPLSHQNVFCCFLSLASSEAVPWGGPSLGSRWRRLQKSLELLDSTVSHGPKALPYAIRRDGEETGWDVCKGTCVITMLRQAVKLSLRGHPCPLPAQSGARTHSPYQLWRGLGPGWSQEETRPASLGLTARLDKLCRTQNQVLVRGEAR